MHSLSSTVAGRIEANDVAGMLLSIRSIPSMVDLVYELEDTQVTVYDADGGETLLETPFSKAQMMELEMYANGEGLVVDMTDRLNVRLPVFLQTPFSTMYLLTALMVREVVKDGSGMMDPDLIPRFVLTSNITDFADGKESKFYHLLTLSGRVGKILDGDMKVLDSMDGATAMVRVAERFNAARFSSYHNTSFLEILGAAAFLTNLFANGTNIDADTGIDGVAPKIMTVDSIAYGSAYLRSAFAKDEDDVADGMNEVNVVPPSADEPASVPSSDS